MEQDKRQIIQIPTEQVKKLIEIDSIRPDLKDYPISKKVHILLQEKLSEILKTKSFMPHGDSAAKGKWVEYIREVIPLHTTVPIAMGMIRHSQETVGIMATKTLVATENDKLWWASYKEDLYNVGNYLITNLKNKEFKKKYFEKYNKILDNTKKLSLEIRKTDLSKLSDEKLQQKYEELYEQAKRFHGMTILDVDAIDIVLEEKMKAKFSETARKKNKNISQTELSAKYNALTTPLELSYVTKEQLKIYLLAKKISEDKKLLKMFEFDEDVIKKEIEKNYPAVKEEINRILEEYWWASMGWASITEKTFDDYVKDLKKIFKENPSINEEIEKIKNFAPKTKEEKQKLAKELDFDEEIKYYLELFEEYAVYHDYRKEGQMKSTSALNKFLFELSRRFGNKYDDLAWCWPSEIKEYIKTKKIDLELARKRKEAMFYLVSQDGIEQYTGEMAIKRRKEELYAKIENIHDFEGIIASIGRATGRAKVCFSATDAIQKVGQGDILVASMTLPDYVPAMKKAAAIVTDEGGITCHAAIVSRELGVPCLVGTKIATKVIEDGDLVEVNAKHGRVKIIEKKKQ